MKSLDDLLKVDDASYPLHQIHGIRPRIENNALVLYLTCFHEPVKDVDCDAFYIKEDAFDAYDGPNSEPLRNGYVYSTWKGEGAESDFGWHYATVDEMKHKVVPNGR